MGLEQAEPEWRTSGFTLKQISDACAIVGVPEHVYAAIVLALQDAPKSAPASEPHHDA